MELSLVCAGKLRQIVRVDPGWRGCGAARRGGRPSAAQAGE